MNRKDVLDSLPIKSDHFVVEVGAGHIPFRYTKLILDKYPFENIERWSDIKKIAPVIKADATKIPIKNKGCDLLFASHVIEHLSDPNKFLEEAKRCSKFVYLEFPKLTRELMFAWGFHRWVIEIEGSKLIFFRNDIPQIFNDFFHRNYDLLFHTWCEQRFEELNNYLFIESHKLDYEFSQKTAFEHVLDHSAVGIQKINFSPQERKRYHFKQLSMIILYWFSSNKLIAFKNWLCQKVNLLREPRLNNQIVEKLICQNCKANDLQLTLEKIICNSCGTTYTKEKGIFVFDI